MSAVRGSGRRPPRLGDYGVVGDGRTVALVSREGAVDWLCFPRFDSPSLFARLLDEERGGTFRVAPVAHARVERRYLGDTAVLQTRFTTAQGALTLTDFAGGVTVSWDSWLLWGFIATVVLTALMAGHAVFGAILGPFYRLPG